MTSQEFSQQHTPELPQLSVLRKIGSVALGGVAGLVGGGIGLLIASKFGAELLPAQEAGVLGSTTATTMVGAFRNVASDRNN